jgi:hypothetical protein
MPSPIRERPGLLLRDPFGYTETVLVLPIPGSRFSPASTGSIPSRRPGTPHPLVGGELVGRPGARALSSFRKRDFSRPTSFALKERKHDAFRQSRSAKPPRGHGLPRYRRGSTSVSRRRCRRLRGKTSLPKFSPLPTCRPRRVRSTARPMISLPTATGPFVILGTSHYGRPERFGLTRKPFALLWEPRRSTSVSRSSLSRRDASSRGLLPRARARRRVQVLFLSTA